MKLKYYLNKNTDAAPLAAFRILFGLILFVSIVRFWSYGWIEKLYLEPNFHFTYYGWEWVKPLGVYTYLIYLICAICALFIMLGYKYRIVTIIFFLCFGYTELMDKTYYLNHYYFVSLISFLLIFIPANRYFSIDAKINPSICTTKVKNSYPLALKLMLCIVYFYAGLFKLNTDWLVEAQPLKTWLSSNHDLPIIGSYLQTEIAAYLASYFGAIYDLTIPFLLFYKPTRKLAFIFVVGFHVFTRILFPIGMFPYIMIVSTLLFFDATFHHKLLNFISKLFKINKVRFDTVQREEDVKMPKANYLFALFFIFQVLYPFRYLCYPGELFWTEEGYRFSWRVMLMEKAGYATFKIKNGKTGHEFYIDNNDFLTPQQQKMMATQADFMIEYAHYLKEHYTKKGIENPEVYVESYVALNGRLSKPYIKPNVNLAAIKEGFAPKNIFLNFNDEIKGL